MTTITKEDAKVMLVNFLIDKLDTSHFYDSRDVKNTDVIKEANKEIRANLTSLRKQLREDIASSKCVSTETKGTSHEEPARD